jgi:hypothetical protein
MAAILICVEKIICAEERMETGTERKRRQTGSNAGFLILNLCPGKFNDSRHQTRSKSKASTKIIERTAELPDGWDLVKELSQRMAEV